VTLFRTPPTELYRREIHSNLDEIDLLCAEIRVLLAPINLDAARFAVELLAHESLSNAVIHGNHESADKRVSLELRVGQAWVRLKVTDEGDGFHWRKDGLLTADVGGTSGRGMALYTLYAERVEFNTFGNQVTLWISRKARALETALEGEHDGFLRD
jgi:anti-sigma regulatory factor (Ser/Thr protein kinase)